MLIEGFNMFEANFGNEHKVCQACKSSNGKLIRPLILSFHYKRSVKTKDHVFYQHEFSVVWLADVLDYHFNIERCVVISF